MRRRRNAATTLALAAACVSYDPTGPHAAAVNGTYAASVMTSLSDDDQTRHDTGAATLVLRDSAYRGRFHGSYRFDSGDSGRVAGTLYPNTIVLTHFGPSWPPLAGVPTLRQLYPDCRIERLAPLHVVGELRNDTLTVAGQGPVFCLTQSGGTTVEREAALAFALLAVRQ